MIVTANSPFLISQSPAAPALSALHNKADRPKTPESNLESESNSRENHRI
jgi:hypothetical protein